MRVHFYLTELQRLLDRPEAMLPMELICGDYSDDYICCSICSRKRFVRTPSFLLYRICIHCKALLFKSVMKLYVRRLSVHNQKEMLRKVHTQLLEFCYRPQYIMKTGLIETAHFFSSQ